LALARASRADSTPVQEEDTKPPGSECIMRAVALLRDEALTPELFAWMSLYVSIFWLLSGKFQRAAHELSELLRFTEFP
jgi:hypothetical protein